MEIIGSVEEVMGLNAGLSRFVSSTCPWIHDDWDPEQIGWIFILDQEDLEMAKALCVVPHVTGNNQEYKASMTINLETFDMWEGMAIQDQKTGYWNVVGIIGQEYGFSIFVSQALVGYLPNFRRNALTQCNDSCLGKKG